MNAIVITLVHLLAFLGGGIFVSTWLETKKVFKPQYALIVAYAVSCLVGLALFFVYAYDPGLGTYVTGLVYLLGFVGFIGCVYKFGKDNKFRKVIRSHILPPLALILIVGTFYSLITFGCPTNNDTGAVVNPISNACLFKDSPGDNLLAEFFSETVIENQDGTPSGDWSLADRPPLQIGSVISLLDILPENASRHVSYQLFSTFLQLAWIAGLWALLKSMNVSKSSQKLVLFLSTFTGFYYFNSVYVWPKLLGAGLAIAGVSLLIYDYKSRKQLNRSEYFYWVTVASLFALSMLSHGSIIFTILPLGLYLLLTKHLPSFKIIIVALSAFLIIYGPWALYQEQRTDSNRLVKWHLAGVIAVDERSTVAAIKDSYTSISTNEWVNARFENFNTLFSIDVDYGSKNPSSAERLRQQEFFATITALSVLNAGWVALLMMRRKKDPTLKKVTPLLVLSLVSLVAWNILMFLPGSAVIHQNSYVTMMLLITSLVVAIGTINKNLQLVVTVSQVIIFLAVWVITLPQDNQQSIWPILSLSILGVAGVALCLYYGELMLLAKRYVKAKQ